MDKLQLMLNEAHNQLVWLDDGFSPDPVTVRELCNYIVTLVKLVKAARKKADKR